MYNKVKRTDEEYGLYPLKKMFFENWKDVNCENCGLTMNIDTKYENQYHVCDFWKQYNNNNNKAII